MRKNNTFSGIKERFYRNKDFTEREVEMIIEIARYICNGGFGFVITDDLRIKEEEVQKLHEKLMKFRNNEDWKFFNKEEKKNDKE